MGRRRLHELLPSSVSHEDRECGSRRDGRRKQHGGLLSSGRGLNHQGGFSLTTGDNALTMHAKQTQSVQLTAGSNVAASSFGPQLSLVPPPTRFKHKTRRREEKPTALLRAWVRVDPHGESSIVHADKMSLAAQLGIQLRDLRLLESQLSNQASVILCRERAIVINMMFVKTIITTDTCYVVSPDDERSIQFMTELKRRLQEPLKMSRLADRLAGGATAQAAGKGSKAPQAQGQQAQQQQQQALMMLQAQQALELPFELRVLEICLDELACDLDERATRLEAAAYPAVDAMAKLADRPHLDRVRRVKDTLIQLYKTTETFHEALQALLDNDKDMWDMNLGAKGAARQLAEETLGLVDRLSEPPHLPPVQEKEGPQARPELQPRHGPLDVVREDEVLMTSCPGMSDHMGNMAKSKPEEADVQHGEPGMAAAAAGYQLHEGPEQFPGGEQYNMAATNTRDAGELGTGVPAHRPQTGKGHLGSGSEHSSVVSGVLERQPDAQIQPAAGCAQQPAAQQDVTAPRSPSPITAMACTPGSWGQHDAASWSQPGHSSTQENSTIVCGVRGPAATQCNIPLVTVQGERTQPMSMAAGGVYTSSSAHVYLGTPPGPGAIKELDSLLHLDDQAAGPSNPRNSKQQAATSITEQLQGSGTSPAGHSDGSIHRCSPWPTPFAAAGAFPPAVTAGLSSPYEPAWAESRRSMSLARLSRRSLAALSMRHGSSLASSSALSSVYDMEVAQVEMILDAYFLHVNHVWRRLKNLSEYIEDTEEMVYSSLNATRNRLLAYGVGFLGMDSMSLLCTGITGILTVNLYTGDKDWPQNSATFLEVVFFGCLGGYLLLAILFAFYMHTGIVQFT